MAKVTGGEALLRHVAAISRAAHAEMQKAIRKAAEEHAAVARSLSPDKTGALDASITIEPGEHDLALQVVVGADYGMHLEFGTQKMPAQPYFRPAYRLTRKKNQARIKRALRKAMKAR